MNYETITQKFTEKQLETFDKESSKIYEDIFGTEMRNIFEGYSTKEETEELLEFIKASFQAGFICGKSSKKQTTKRKPKNV